jgi:phospholipase C
MTIEPGKLRFIVLMLENRSFDHLIGYLPHADPVAFNGLKGTEFNFVDEENTKTIYVDKKANYTIKPGPDHSHAGVRYQLFGDFEEYGGRVPSMTGFVKNYEQVDEEPGLGPNVMKCFDPQKIPVIATLAMSYRVCANWFSSVPGQTWPNRNFAHAGTSDGEVNIAKRFYCDETIFEKLQQEGRSWAIYHDGIAQSMVFDRLWKLPGDGFRSIDDFERDIDQDRLPDYSFIEPHYLGKKSDCMHPGSSYVGHEESRFRAGERLIARVYNKLSGNEKVWAKTVLLIAFDEHGGFYDHVAPGPAVPPDDKVWHDHDGHEFKFDLLGVRVPAIVVSPWVERRSVDKRIYDHTTIIATARKLFAPNIELKKRVECAPNLVDTLLDSPVEDKPVALPSVPLAPEMLIAEDLMPGADVHLDESQESLVWLAKEVARAIGTPGAAPLAPEITTATPPRSFESLAELDTFEEDFVARFRRRHR